MFDRSIPDYLGTTKARIFFYYHNGMLFTVGLYAGYMGMQQLWIQVINNITIVEVLKGAGMTWIPFCYNEFNEKAIYFMSSIYNFVQIFGTNPFTWLLPVVPNVPFHGIYYPTVPDLLPHEQYALQKQDTGYYIES